MKCEVIAKIKGPEWASVSHCCSQVILYARATHPYAAVPLRVPGHVIGAGLREDGAEGPGWDAQLSTSAFLSGFRAQHPTCSQGRRRAVCQRKELQKLRLGSGRQGQVSWSHTSSMRFVMSVHGGPTIFSFTVLLSSNMVVQSTVR